MMTKSKLLVSEAVDELDCTPEERSDIFEHLRDADITHVNGASHAREIAESYLQGVRDANAEDNAEPKWTRHYWTRLCLGYDPGERFPGCMVQARWEMLTEINGTQFRIYACDKHAGKAIPDEGIAKMDKEETE